MRTQPQNQESTAKTYNIIDRQTGAKVNKNPYVNVRVARRKADKLDNIYGAYRYAVRLIV